ncbi:MAG TPA: sugar transferase [Anaerolineae bacterium]|jgi:lipopolysaccharide/colanic/teichoic acid biosynthesis glycosyltransferase|nr:sugar transferase [Anaerolineae bacterium]
MSKRLFDIIVAFPFLVLTWPLIAIGGIAAKMSSPGPAFFLSKRAGLHNRPFYLVKIRTMVAGEEKNSSRISEKDDMRVTRAGRILRKSKLDELPQFWNVLRGDMSIVGPRPEDWDIVQHNYTHEQRRSLEVRPGITSPAQVRWFPDMTYHDPPPEGISMEEYYLERHLPAKLAVELRYIDQRNLLLDFKILAQTAWCLLIHSWLVPPEVQSVEVGDS